MEDKIKDILHTDNHKEKKCILMITTFKNSGTIKWPNSKIYGVEKRTKIQTKDIGNMFNEIIAENFPNVCARSILNFK
jgi:hypothetical protein